jgi:ribosomal protein S14
MTDSKKERKELDTLWSKLVKLRAGNKCEKCGRKDTLISHHIYSRSNPAVRWDERNGCCLCVSHHTFSAQFSAHKTPIEFIEWLREKRGETWYQTIRMVAFQTRNKTDKKLLKIYLENEIKKIN